MKKITKTMALILCSVISLTGCGGSKPVTKASGSIASKNESKAENVEEKNESLTPTPEEVKTTDYNFDGLLLKIPEYWGNSSQNNQWISWTIKDNAILGLQSLNFGDGLEQITDTNVGSAIKTCTDTILTNLKLSPDSVATENSSKHIGKYVSGRSKFTVPSNGINMDMDVNYVFNTDSKKIDVILFGQRTDVKKDYKNDFEKMLSDINVESVAVSAPSAAEQPQETPVPSETPTPVPTQAPADNGQVTPELKAFLDSYEAFMDQYVAFMQKYQANPTNAELLSEYSTYIDKLSDFEKKANEYSSKEGEMSTADYNYYIDTMARISKKMISASLSS